MKYKNKIIFMLLLLLFPVNVFAYGKSLIASGKNIGIEVRGSGALVVGFYKDSAKKSGLEIGDRITNVNDASVNSAEDIEKNIKEGKNDLEITRNNKKMNINIDILNEENTLKTGIYVKDKITGIGTLTYIDPETNEFGALGHEIDDATTKTLFKISGGSIFNSSIVGISKSFPGDAGAKRSIYDKNDVYGTVTSNFHSGIYGKYEKAFVKGDAIELGTPSVGDAIIRTEVDEAIKDYKINIINTNKNGERNILFAIADNGLLSKTGGIVQGMSGSPIIQNGKIVGAVTHVIVDDPKKGYGIDIKKMLEKN